jgi:glutamate-5-semialdehyde dehydrogenase
MAKDLEWNQEQLIKENEKDLAISEKANLSSSFIDRLRLTPSVIQGMAEGLREVSRLPDPVGEVIKMWKRPNGLMVGRMRIPIGVIGIIYESRPNVTADAAGLCLKSGNSVILRGGSEASHSNQAIGHILRKVLIKMGLPQEAIQIFSYTEASCITLEYLYWTRAFSNISPCLKASRISGASLTLMYTWIMPRGKRTLRKKPNYMLWLKRYCRPQLALS